MLAEIKQQALAQLSTEGAAQLSLRALARDLGIVPSGLYRYFASRDDLLTALIVDAYRDLAAAVTSADGAVPRRRLRRRWTAGCMALRSWALAQPQRFQLIYGSPVPGYQAPADTVGPAAAVITALLAVVSDFGTAGGVSDEPAPRSRALRRQLTLVATDLGIAADPSTTAVAVGALAQLIGLLILEFGGHLVGGFEPADALYAHHVRVLADHLGLTD